MYIVAYTGDVTDDNVVKCVRYGFDEIIFKPIN